MLENNAVFAIHVQEEEDIHVFNVSTYIINVTFEVVAVTRSNGHHTTTTGYISCKENKS